jgi:hypothetical protein
VDFEPVAGQRAPVWTAVVDEKRHRNSPPIKQFELQIEFQAALNPHAEFRGVGLDRLPTILAKGVDVEPTTAPIYVSNLEKAWEYGGLPKVVMAFDGRHLQRTYREVISDAPDDEIARLMVDYPNRIESRDGKRLWLTRLPETSADSSYEVNFARWIPGDPFDALLAVFVFKLEGTHCP